MQSLFRLSRVSVPVCWLTLAVFAPRAGAQAVPALARPAGLVFDAQGDLFVADAGRHVIEKLDGNGMVSVVAGTGVQGFSGDGGPAASAQLDGPTGVAIDASGTLFIADSHNARVRRVDAGTGLISTVAGAGVAGFSGDGAPAVRARLAMPTALMLDGAGHLLVADSGNQRVRQIDLGTGIITTVAGSGVQGAGGEAGPAPAASLDAPSGLALGAQGDLLVADTGNGRVLRVNKETGAITTLVGSGLRRPVGLAVLPSGALVVADAGRQQVLQVDVTKGVLGALAGQGTQGFAGDSGASAMATLDGPLAVAVSPAGTVAVADAGNGRVRLLTPSTGAIATVLGDGALAEVRLGFGTAIGPQVYGAAQISVALSSSRAGVGGPVSLLEGSGVVAQAVASGGVGSFDLRRLPVGVHHLVASYAGDRGHLPARSAVDLTITPAPVTAVLQGPATMLFGQTPPVIVATLSGVTPWDSASVSAAVTTGANAASVPGAYPVTVSLAGSAAGNYMLVPGSPVQVVVAKAPAATTLLNASGSLAVAVVSTTSGVPTGAVTLLTGAGTALTRVPLNAAGRAVLSESGLANGSYSLTAVYSGDADFLPGQSGVVNVTVGPAVVPGDFSLGSAGAASVTVKAGETAKFPFTLKMTGEALAGPVVITASGVPIGATATFDPAVLVPGAGGAFTMTVVTGRAAAGLGWVGVVVASVVMLRRGRRALVGSLALLALCGCGARYVPEGSGAGTTKSYAITVTGTSTRADGTVLQRSSAVTLTVE